MHDNVTKQNKEDVCKPELVVACTSRNIKLVKALLDAGCDPEVQTAAGKFPLIFAAASGEYEIVWLLLHAGAAPEQTDNQGKTPLMEAAAGSHAEVVKLLLKHGAKVDTRNIVGETALIYMGMAAANGYVMVNDSVEPIDEGYVDVEETEYAFARMITNFPNLVRLLLEAGADVNARSNDGSAPLHYFVGNKLLGCAEILIDHGADVNAQDNTGETPLMRAIPYYGDDCSMEVIDLLLEHGADVDIQRNTDGWTALMNAAADARNQNALDRLIAAGAVMSQNILGETPLMIALSRARNDGNINTLLKAGADIIQETRYGFTARDYAMHHNYREDLFVENRWRKIFLTMVEERDSIAVSEFDLGKPDVNLLKQSLREAVFADNLEMAVLLLRMGTPANSTNFGGETALMYAACRANVEMVKLLLSNGADVTLRDSDGETALEKMRVTFPVEGGFTRYYMDDFEADAEKDFGEMRFKEIKAAQREIERLLL